MFFRRKVFDQLEKELETKEIIIITGMRRVGKTTALNYLFGLVESENKAIFDLENPLHRKIFEEENYDNIWNNLLQFGIDKQRKSYIFLDEVQNLPEISRVVKYLYDHWGIKFILTGSSSYYLKNLFPESLAGRKLIFEMFPLTFEEFLIFKDVKRIEKVRFFDKAKEKNKISYEKLISYYKEYLEFGGFPSVILEDNGERKRLLLEETFTSYFEKDVKNLADFKKIAKLRDLILLLISRVGSRLDIAKLANSLSVSRETVYAYLSFLDQTYFIKLLPRFSGSIDRQAAGSRKLFFCDCGIVNILGKVSQGQLFEQSIFQNLRTIYDLCYYNKNESKEIDFIVNQKIALEVKLSVSQKDVSNVKLRAKALSLAESYVVSLSYSDLTETLLATDI